MVRRELCDLICVLFVDDFVTNSRVSCRKVAQKIWACFGLIFIMRAIRLDNTMYIYVGLITILLVF